MGVLIRSAAPSDICSLIALSRRTISAVYRSFLGDEVVDGFIGSGASDRYVEDNIEHCSIILRDDMIVGYAVRRDDLIDLMIIDPPFHRQGLGTALLREVETALFQTFGEGRLESFEENRSANSFYRKNGWCEVGEYFDEAAGSNKIVFSKSG